MKGIPLILSHGDEEALFEFAGSNHDLVVAVSKFIEHATRVLITAASK